MLLPREIALYPSIPISVSVDGTKPIQTRPWETNSWIHLGILRRGRLDGVMRLSNREQVRVTELQRELQSRLVGKVVGVVFRSCSMCGLWRGEGALKVAVICVLLVCVVFETYCAMWLFVLVLLVETKARLLSCGIFGLSMSSLSSPLACCQGWTIPPPRVQSM